MSLDAKYDGGSCEAQVRLETYFDGASAGRGQRREGLRRLKSCRGRASRGQGGL